MPKPAKKYPHSNKRQGERLRRQIDKWMVSVGSKGFRAPMTRKEAGL